MRIIDLIALESSVFLNDEKTHCPAQSSPPRSMVMLINIQVLGPAARSLRKQAVSKWQASEAGDFREEKNV